MLAAGLLLAACGGTETVEELTILRHGWMAGGPTALLTGHVRFVDGCVRIQQGSDAAYVVLWPSDARLHESGGRLRVATSGVLLSDGDRISLGGGEYKDLEWVRGTVGATIPEACVVEHYWLATEVIDHVVGE